MRPVIRVDKLATFVSQLSRKSGNFNFLEPSWPIQACIVTALPANTLQCLAGNEPYPGRFVCLQIPQKLLVWFLAYYFFRGADENKDHVY
jgi:hypothetical protein